MTPKEILRGKLVKKEIVMARYGATAVNEPKLPVGTEVLVQLEPAGKLIRVAKLETPTGRC